MPVRGVIETPRWGLTLKRLDEHKPAFWMADYRHLTYPEYYDGQKKNFVILSMIDKGVNTTKISERAKC